MAFFALCAICLAEANDIGSQGFYSIATLFFGVMLLRSLRVLVETTEEWLTIRTLFKTTRLPREEVVRAELRPMRTASPFRHVKRYAALALLLNDGNPRQFDDVSASESHRRRVADIADHINNWCGSKMASSS